MSNLIVPSRRGFLTGAAAALIAAPAIVRAESLMPIKVQPKIVVWPNGMYSSDHIIDALRYGMQVTEWNRQVRQNFLEDYKFIEGTSW